MEDTARGGCASRPRAWAAGPRPGNGRALPALGGVAAIGGGALAVLGWLGGTTLTLTFAGGDRVYAVNGRNTMLLDFAEAVSDKLMQVKR